VANSYVGQVVNLRPIGNRPGAGPRKVFRRCGKPSRYRRRKSLKAHFSQLRGYAGSAGPSRSRRRLRPPCALCQIVLIESLPDQRLDDRLAAHVEVLGSLIQLLQHAGRNVHVNALNRLNHAAFALEEMGNVLALIGETRDRIGRNRFGGVTNFPHIIGSPRRPPQGDEGHRAAKLQNSPRNDPPPRRPAFAMPLPAGRRSPFCLTQAFDWHRPASGARSGRRLARSRQHRRRDSGPRRTNNVSAPHPGRNETPDCCFGSLVRSCYGSIRGGSWHCCSRPRPATLMTALRFTSANWPNICLRRRHVSPEAACPIHE
jgi:hypothetical protein